jgi:hypothetical protein
MFACREDRDGDWCYLRFGDERTLRMVFGGRHEYVPVVLTEEVEGRFYGWVSSIDGQLTMVQPSRIGFEMQFAYGSAVEVAKGRGEVVRLAVSEA